MLSDMLQDAHRCVAQPGLMLPWETPEMCAIFGPESLVPALPKVAPAPAYEPTEIANAEGLEDVAPPAACCLFQRFVVKPVAKKHVLDLNERPRLSFSSRMLRGRAMTGLPQVPFCLPCTAEADLGTSNP